MAKRQVNEILRIHNWQVSSATLRHCYSQYHR